MDKLSLGMAKGSSDKGSDNGQNRNAVNDKGNKETNEGPEKDLSRNGGRKSNCQGKHRNEGGGIMHGHYRGRADRAQTGIGWNTDRGGMALIRERRGGEFGRDRAGDHGRGRGGEFGRGRGGEFGRDRAGDHGRGRGGEFGRGRGGDFGRGRGGDFGRGRGGEFGRGRGGDHGRGRGGEFGRDRGGEFGRGRGGEFGRGRGGEFGRAERQVTRCKVQENGVRAPVRSAGMAKEPHGLGLGFKTLEKLSEEDPSVIAFRLSSHPALKTVLGERAIRRDLIELLCLILSKALKSQSDRSTLQYLAGVVKDSSFFCNILPHYLGGLGIECNPGRKALYPQHLENILAILSAVLNMFPASSLHAVGLLLTLFEATVNRLRASGVDLSDQMEETVENLQGLITHLQKRCMEGTMRSDRDKYALLAAGGGNPGDDQQNFRLIPIYPTLEELHLGQRPFLRPNVTTQRYSSTHIYLDTHFRLLREDFVCPLREGIQQLLKDQANSGRTEIPLKKKQFDDIRVYFDVQVKTPVCTNNGLAYIVGFNVDYLKFVRWENSKRLIYGSLICMSCDNFESFLLATVSDRDPKELREGRVQIKFMEESRVKLAGIPANKSFLMIEATTYFEAYRYVLEGLQEQDEDDMPFQKYIVECNNEVQPPAYLQRSAQYNLSSTAHPDYEFRMKPFDCLNPRAWPRMEELGLDESQIKAFQLALTKELAIIQGPPGTGKTYVGLKIAKALLTNTNLWRAGDKTEPMLVVCYTNHALDQFLEGILDFLPNGIVRVGGRSNSEKLKRFTLRELAISSDFKRTLPRDLSSAYKTIYSQLCEEERNIQEQSIRMICSLKGVLRESMLRNFISDTHWKSLQRQDFLSLHGFFTSNRKNVINEWLGLDSMHFLQRETEDAATGYVGDGNAEEEDLIEIIEEANLIKAERYIEDWNQDSHEEGNKKKKMGEVAEEIGKLMLAMNLEEAQTPAEQNNDEWQMTKEQKKRMKQKAKKELKKTTAMSEEEENNVLDVWRLRLDDRWQLYRLWLKRFQLQLRTKMLRLEDAYQNTVERLAYVKQQQNICLLQRSTVIGMTTTGAAKFRNVLQQLRPRIVIVEEAAEVLEAHIITTLSKDCQHLILIGDHQQLRPSATVYELAKNFSLEMSMFERLVNMGLPFVKLGCQHRMRPEIARLLTPHIYSELQNHPSVLAYEDIKGLKSNLFFVEHSFLEEDIKDGKSHQNQHEAKFVVSLCHYLLLQEYKPEQITILTTYTGQLHCLRQLMPAKKFAGVKVHVVDKYQGEENDIVLLSLVRSNVQGKVGFLSIPNRVCVALSRAKKGLYCIGNGVMLSQVKLWSNIFHTLREKDQVGKALTLCCQNHPDKQVQATCAEDFKQAPEGGCTQPCVFRLDCGHVCTRACHPYDPQHKEYKCGKPCQKILCDLGHRCKLVCHKECPETCPVKLEKIVPQCQHKQMVPCQQDPETFMCQAPCPKRLQCGHQCISLCGEPCGKSRCKEIVTLTLKCGHVQKNACFYRTETNEPLCTNPCDFILKCGHPCSGTCGKCLQGRFHMPCSKACDRLLICSHKCKEPCTGNCPPCERPCENRCVHSKCMKKCGQPCVPCSEPCARQCRHQRCLKLCCEPCDRPPCRHPCDKQLECGHKCIGLCGDKCPDKCRVCHHEEVTEIFFGSEDEPDARFIQLQDCNHVIECTAMDKYMGLEDNGESNAAIKLKECPKCRAPIRKNLRYGAYINKCLTEIEMVKEKINGQLDDNRTRKRALRRQWLSTPEGGKLAYQKYIETINDRLSKSDLTANDLWVLENQIDFQKRIGNLYKNVTKFNCDISPIFHQFADEFVMRLYSHRQTFSEQQVFDLGRELQRLTYLATLNEHYCVANNRLKLPTVQGDVQKIRNILEKPRQFTEEEQTRVKEALDELKRKVPSTGLGISDEERKMIVSAIKMPSGHWHKCPNGHVYLITECGGAMQRRKCPDCDASIGGQSHTLERGNAVATEMDGAQHSAWSEANNLLNFDRLDF